MVAAVAAARAAHRILSPVTVGMVQAPLVQVQAQGRLLVFYENGFIQSAQRHSEVPQLTDEHLRAVDVFDRLASSDDLRMDYVLQPGDIQLLHNHQIVHTRSEYLDFEVLSSQASLRQVCIVMSISIYLLSHEPVLTLWEVQLANLLGWK